MKLTFVCALASLLTFAVAIDIKLFLDNYSCSGGRYKTCRSWRRRKCCYLENYGVASVKAGGRGPSAARLLTYLNEGSRYCAHRLYPSVQLPACIVADVFANKQYVTGAIWYTGSLSRRGEEEEEESVDVLAGRTLGNVTNADQSQFGWSDGKTNWELSHAKHAALGGEVPREEEAEAFFKTHADHIYVEEDA